MRSTAIQYALARTIVPDEYVSIAVIGRQHEQARSISFSLDIVLSCSSAINSEVFSSGSTATLLDATYLSDLHEIRISNIEGRALERGQSFALHTYKQLLELVPECTSIVLYNIIDSKAETIVDRARSTPDWVIPPEGVLLRSLYECGFQKVVGIQFGGPAYRSVRASNRRVEQVSL